jgi:riboflavin-specific deaminase-like protein
VGPDVPPRLRRLVPADGTTTPDEAIRALDLGARAPPDRPYLVLNMVSSADGKATLEGKTKGLGNEADHQIFHHLRTQADAVMVAAGTLRAERYGRMVRDPGLREKRLREGLSAEPLAVVVSGRLEVPIDIPLLADPESHVVVLTSSRELLPAAPAVVEYLRGEGPPLDLAGLLGRLRTEHGVRSVLCEGGPTLNAALLHQGLVDELFLSMAPLLVGGAMGLTIVAGEALPEPAPLEIDWLLESEHNLFLRLRVRR